MGGLPWRRRRINFFDTSKSEIRYSPGATSVQVLSPSTYCSLWKNRQVLVCGFALPLIGLQNHSHSISTHVLHSEVSCSLLFKFVTNLFDPCKIQTQEWELSLFTEMILISTPYLPCNLLVATFNTGQFWCSLGSILLVVMLVLLLEDCIRDKPLHKIVKNLQCLSSWNTVQFQQHSEILHPYRIYSLCLVVTASLFFLHIVAIENFLIRWVITIQENFVLVTLSTSEEFDCPITTTSPRSFGKGFMFFTHFCDCSVKTKLIYRSNCSKNGLNRFQIDTIRKLTVFLLTPLLLSWPLDTRLEARKTRCQLSLCFKIIFSAILSHSPCGLSSLTEDHFFLWTKTKKWPFTCSKFLCIKRKKLCISFAFSFVASWPPWNVIWTWTWRWFVL